MGLRVMAGAVEDVTVNGFEADLDPWVATTDLDPSDDAGTVKVAENPPLLLGVTGLGVGVMVAPPKVTVTGVVESKLVPVTVSGVPTGPEVGLRVMAGAVEDVTVNGFEADLDPCVAVTTLSPPEDDTGTVKVPLKVPVEVVVNGDGFVVTSIAPNLMATSELGSKLIPATVTETPTGPDVGSRIMIGFVEAVTVNVFEAEISSNRVSTR